MWPANRKPGKRMPGGSQPVHNLNLPTGIPEHQSTVSWCQQQKQVAAEIAGAAYVDASSVALAPVPSGVIPSALHLGPFYRAMPAEAGGGKEGQCKQHIHCTFAMGILVPIKEGNK